MSDNNEALSPQAQEALADANDERLEEEMKKPTHTWNHRVVRVADASSESGHTLLLCEVHYTDGVPTLRNHGATIVGDDLAELTRVVSLFKHALQQPILEDTVFEPVGEGSDDTGDKLLQLLTVREIEDLDVDLGVTEDGHHIHVYITGIGGDSDFEPSQVVVETYDKNNNVVDVVAFDASDENILKLFALREAVLRRMPEQEDDD